MSKKSIFEGTFLQEIMDFKGSFIEPGHVKVSRLLIGEKEVGDMTDLEKTIFSVAKNKEQQYEDLIKSVIGIHPDEIPDGREEEYQEKWDTTASEEDKKKFEVLKREEGNLIELMWNIIRCRIDTDNIPTVGVRPGFKIVTGYSIGSAIGVLFAGNGIEEMMEMIRH